jgi:hypothetical protein
MRPKTASRACLFFRPVAMASRPMAAKHIYATEFNGAPQSLRGAGFSN